MFPVLRGTTFICIITRSTSLGVAKAGNLKLDFMAKSIGIHVFEFEDMFRCLRDNENLKKHFGHMYTLNRFKSIGWPLNKNLSCFVFIYRED